MTARLLFFLFCCGAAQAAPLSPPPVAIPAIDRMPDLPQPLVLRDWKQVARNFDRLAFDYNRPGEFLPLLWWDASRVNGDLIGFALPSHVGLFPPRRSGDGIACLGAVLGATGAGIDKQHQNGRDWVAMLKIYFARKNGTDLYLNGPAAVTGDSFWPEILPSILFYQVRDAYRRDPEMEEQFRAVADRWLDASLVLGGTAAQAPDFDHAAFDFSTLRAVDNGREKQPDAAGGVAWLEYTAYAATKNAVYLHAAEGALRFLDQRADNPFYECLLPYGVYAAVRMNAEEGAVHDTAKLFGWIFDAGNPRQWGVAAGRWNGVPVDGLVGNLRPGQEMLFAMDGFLAAGALAPIPRYDPRFAHAVGKWILNLAVNSRYFYPDAWPAGRQPNWRWSAKEDRRASIAYEGLRRRGLRCDRAAFLAGSKDSPQIWKCDLPAGSKHILIMEIAPSATPGQAAALEVASSRHGPWRPVFSFQPGSARRCWAELKMSGAVYFRLSGAPPLRELAVYTPLDQSPWPGGQAVLYNRGETDLSVRASAFAGVLGAAIAPTDVEGILKIDCRATEAFPAPAYPTFLFYNPYAVPRLVHFPVAPAPADLYDALAHRFLACGVKGSAAVTIPGKGVQMIVVCPPNGQSVRKGDHLLYNGVVIDYALGLVPGVPAAGP